MHARYCFIAASAPSLATAASAPPPLRRRSFRRLGPVARHRRHAPAVPRRRRGFALPVPPLDKHPARTRKYDLHTLERVG